MYKKKRVHETANPLRVLPETGHWGLFPQIIQDDSNAKPGSDVKNRK